jgi:TRAP-type C4-dicarboxylate transport system permease small subunit
VSVRRLLDRLYDGAGYLAGLCVLAILVLMIGASAGRELGLRVGGANDIVAWLCAAAAFLAMAHTFRFGDFVRVTLLLEKLSPGAVRALEIAGLTIATFAVGYLAFWAARFTLESWRLHDMAGGMVAIPIWIPQSSFVVGAVLFLIAVIDELVNTLRGNEPTYARLAAERHARGDFSEDV